MNILSYLRCQWDRVLAVVAILLGAVALVIGWFGVSDSVLPAEQIPYVVSGGLGGIFLLGVGSLMWLSADIRDEWRKLDALDDGDTDEVVLADEDVTGEDGSEPRSLHLSRVGDTPGPGHGGDIADPSIDGRPRRAPASH
jgi:hypothetical protein